MKVAPFLGSSAMVLLRGEGVVCRERQRRTEEGRDDRNEDIRTETEM